MLTGREKVRVLLRCLLMLVPVVLLIGITAVSVRANLEGNKERSQVHRRRSPPARSHCAIRGWPDD